MARFLDFDSKTIDPNRTNKCALIFIYNRATNLIWFQIPRAASYGHLAEKKKKKRFVYCGFVKVKWLKIEMERLILMRNVTFVRIEPIFACSSSILIVYSSQKFRQLETFALCGGNCVESFTLTVWSQDEWRENPTFPENIFIHT